MKTKTRTYVISILIPLAVGAVAGLLTRGSMDAFSQLRQPPLSPPGILFPIVWTILYTLMGIGAALISLSGDEGSGKALRTYWLQLAVNFVWPILFFALGLHFLALLWLILLVVLVIRMILQFYKISTLAAYLQIPYLLWLLFATYLNAGIWLLNR